VLALIIAVISVGFAIKACMSSEAKTTMNILAMHHCHVIDNGVHETTEDCLGAVLKKIEEGLGDVEGAGATRRSVLVGAEFCWGAISRVPWQTITPGKRPHQNRGGRLIYTTIT
jgi:hypothetical protein